jgi:hypothetical protein
MKNLSTFQAILHSSHESHMNTSQWRNYVSIWGSIFPSLHSLQKWSLFFQVFCLKFCLPSTRSPSQEANSYSASKEFPHLLWNPKVHYHAHKSPSLNPILSHMNPVHTLILSLFKIHVNTILTPMAMPLKWSLSFRFSLTNSTHISHLYHASCMHCWAPSLITLICVLFRYEYKFWSLPLCFLLFPQSKVQILSSASVLTHPNLHLHLG